MKNNPSFHSCQNTSSSSAIAGHGKQKISLINNSSRLLLAVALILASSLVALSQPASNLIIKPVSGLSDIRLDWTNGGNNKRLVIIKDGTGVFTPVNGSTYTPNTDFNLGTNLTTGGGVVKSVFDGTGTTVTVQNLVPGTTYRVEVYEYNTAGNVYNTAVATRNPQWFRTFNSTGDNSWAVPTGINFVTAHAWGSGGGGGGGSTNGGADNGGSGGGAGAYAGSNGVAVSGTMHAFVAPGGAGGSGNGPVTPGDGSFSWFGTSSAIASALVKADGANSGTNNSTANGGNGGTVAASIGTIKVKGGRGGKGADQAGGGGGSSGGPDFDFTGAAGADGSDGVGTGGGAGAAAVIGGAAGTTGQSDGTNTAMAAAPIPGGGGGGTQDSNTSVGAPGGDGLVLISYTQPINQNIVFAANITKAGGAAVTIVSSGAAGNAVWFAPAGTTTFAASSTMTTAGGTATSINAPTTGGAYQLFVVDAAGNASLASTATLTVDATPPVFSATAPVTGAFVGNSNVSYTLSEDLAAGANTKIRFNRTAGPVDGASPHDYLLTGAELTSGAHTNIPLASVTLVNGATYTVTFQGNDLVGNPATTVTATGVIMDTSPPVALTVGSVVTTGGNTIANFWNTTNTGVNVSVPVDLANSDPTIVGGTIQLQARISSGSFADIGSPYTILNGDRGSSKVLSLTAGQITAIAGYANATTLQFTAVVKDQAGNSATVTQSATNLAVDIVLPTITATAPATGGLVNTSNVSYTLSEAISAVAGSKVTWLRTGGAPDGTPHNYLLTGGELTSGAHTNITLATVTLVNTTVYSVIFDAQDVAGNPAATVTNTNVTFDTSPPTITATSPPSSSIINVATVSYTLSENCQSATVDYNRTGGSPDSNHNLVLTAGQLTAGPHTISTGLPTLVDGTVYSIIFNATDIAGNPATPVTSLTVTYDVSPPAPLTVGSVITTGGNSVANFWNTTNTGVDIQVPVDLANADPSIAGGSIQLRARISSGSFANIGSPYTILNGDRGSNKTFSLTSGQITAIAGYANATTLQFTAVVTDIAGNPATVTQSATNLAVDIVLPVFSAVSPASSSFVHNSNVTYTLSEAIVANAGSKISWIQTGGVADGGSPHDYLLSGGELTSGAHTNIPLASVTLVEGSIYSVTFDGVDVAGNPSATLTRTVVEEDATAPNAFTTGAVATTGGTIVPGYWNGTNTGVNVQVPVDIGTLDATVVGGTIQLQARVSSGSFADIGSPYTILVGDRNTTKTMALTAGNITGITGYAQGATLEFLAVITDRAGNPTTGTASASTLFVDTVLPVISAVSPANSSFVNTSNVSYTLSEAAAAVASSKIVWTQTGGAADGGSPHTYTLTGAELAAGAHTNIPLASVSLVNTSQYTVTFDVRDLAGNQATTITRTVVTYDITPPAVTGIVIGPAPPLAGIGTTNGTSAASVPFQVTFGENVSGLDPTDFVLSNTGSVAGNIASVTGGPLVWTVTVNSITGTGTMRLDFASNGTVRDQANNSTITSFNAGGAGGTYSIVLPQPATHVTGFTASPGGDNYSVTLNWSTTVPTATNYLIRAKGQLDDDSNGTYVTVNDGSPIADDFLFTDGNGHVNVPAGTTTYTFATLLSGKTYTFEIIPYALSSNNSSDNINYFNNGAQPAASTTVTTGSFGTLTVGSTLPPGAISSLTTSYIGAVNQSFRIQEDGAPVTFITDNARTRFTQLVIKAGAFNSVTDWSDVLAEAQLIDITDNPGSPILTTAITANTITFSGLSIGSNGAGAVDDNELKEYTLRVRLKSALTGGANLTADNQVFDFQVDNSSFTYYTAVSQPSRLAAVQSTSTGTGRNTIAVVASQITFNPLFGGVQPPAAALVLSNLSVTPVARAIDANGNTDKNFNSPLAVTTSGGAGVNSTPLAADGVAPNQGVYTFPAGFQYTDVGTGPPNNGTLTLTSGITGTSSNVTVSFSSTTRVVAGAFVEPLTYSSLLTTDIAMDVNNNRVFDFDVVEDNGAGGDGSPTRITQMVFTQGPGNQIPDWTQAIAVAWLFDGVNPVQTISTVGATSITFTAMNTAGLGLVADNATKNYKLYIQLQTAPGGSLPNTWDGLHLDFRIRESDISLTSVSSKINPGDVQTSGAGNLAIDVVATQLVFTRPIDSPTLVSKDISLQQVTTLAVPQVVARDVYNSLDLGYNVAASLTDNDSPVRTFINPPTTFASGVLNFPNNFQYTSIGNLVTPSTATLTVTSGAMSIASPPFNVKVGTATRIAAGAASPATISSLVNASTGVPVFHFDVKDDFGASGTSDDGAPTRITKITITQKSGGTNTIPNWAAVIAGAQLTDGPNTLVGVVGATSITFSGMNPATLGLVNDNATKSYTLNIWLNASLGALATSIDGNAFGFEVINTGSNITTLTSGTGIVASENANSGAANVIDVTATALRFNATLPSSATLNVPFSPASVEAVDANGNRDLTFDGAVSTVRAFSNAAGVSMSGQPAVNSTTFTLGLLTLSGSFQFTSGSSGQHVDLSITAGLNTSCGTNYLTNGLCITSPVITLATSFESSIVGDPTFGFPPKITYVNFQENSDITNSTTSLEIARMLLVDGSRVGFAYGAGSITTSTENDGQNNTDVDGAPTDLTSLTLHVTNSSNLRRIALYANGVEIPGTEQAVNDAAGTAFHDFVFTGSPLASAVDNNITVLSVRASFRGTAPEVTDHDPINISVVAAAASSTGGSQFYQTGVPPYIAGVSGGLQSPPGVNIIDVVATKIDFVSQPGAFSGKNEPVPVPGTVQARDQLGLRDLDFDGVTATISAPPPVLVGGTFTFSQGNLDISSMTYSSQGDGTMTITAPSSKLGTISSSTTLNPTVDGINNTTTAKPSNHVDVLHTTASYTNGGPGGVVTSLNLVGNTANKVIFGVTFSAPYTVAGSPNQPLLQKFTISFNHPTAGSFLNMRVFESTSPTYSASLPDVTGVTINAAVTQPTSSTLRVDFTGAIGGPRDLRATPGLSYFLMVDIDPTASGATLPMQPSVVDAGFGFATNPNITVSNGSSVASVFGQTYTFASIFPPILQNTYPAVGQSNIDPSQPEILMYFSVPVVSLDDAITLTEVGGASTVLHTVLGQGAGVSGTPQQPIRFSIPPGTLQPNKQYYVTVAQGNLNVTPPNTPTGIMDAANNLYPGISYSGTFYFRTTNSAPPRLLGSGTTPSVSVDPNVSDITQYGATLNATFDQPGKAYYLVSNTGSPTPSITDINGSSTYSGTVIARGNFQVDNTNPISQYGVMTPIAGIFPAAPTTGTTYDVWMYAETFSEKSSTTAPFAPQKTIIPATAAYGSATPPPPPPTLQPFGAGQPGPTLQFTVFQSTATSPILNSPAISVCNSSYQFLNSPIVITESAPGQFFNGGTQTMNLVLPAGFQFDVTQTPANVPKYGALQLDGTDFVIGSGSISFLGNSVVKIVFANNNNASIDRIVISGLRVLATSSSSGSIFRLGGNALTAYITDGAPVGTLTSFDAPNIAFDNSYSTNALSISQPGAVVTAIPDNFQPAQITLTPYIPSTSNDFGPSIFSGQGVNINQLTLTAVTPDVPFNVTITHTDNNGCISNNAIQYTVYNHTTAVNISKAVPNNPLAGAPPTAFVQSPFCVINDNFINYTGTPPFAVNSPTLGTSNTVYYAAFNNLAGYQLRKTASVPAITAALPANPGTQIMQGTDWKAIITALPFTVGTSVNLPGSGAPVTQSYGFDLAKILDASAQSLGAIQDPYQNFRSALTSQGNYYYKGGSLGVIEVTGQFQSTSNATVIVPRTQVIEIFIPAVPLVEAAVSNRTALDISDPSNPIGTDNTPAPGPRPNGPTNRGTPIYCQAGGLINITGFPAALGGSSTGTFALFDAATGASLGTPVGFKDNGNGTATIDPNVPTIKQFPTDIYFDPSGTLRNSYKSIKVVYTYKDDISPCSTSAYQVIRITSNPVAAFTWQTQTLSNNAPTSGATCVGNPIEFTSTSGIPGTGTTPPTGDPTASVIGWSWDFGDVAGTQNVVPGPGVSVITPLINIPGFSSSVQIQAHKFDTPSGLGSHYVVSHRAISNFGCLSGPPQAAPLVPVAGAFTQNIDIGGIPVVKFKLDGVSKIDKFRFNSNDTQTPFGATAPFTPAGNQASGNTTVSQNDGIKWFDWDFGDGSPVLRVSGLTTQPTDAISFNANIDAYNNDVQTHIYSALGKKDVNLTVTSYLGCVNSLSFQNTYRSVVVLDRIVIPPGNPTAVPPVPAGVYSESFETSNGNWQVWGTGATTAAMSAASQPGNMTWAYGSASDVPAPPAGSKYWKTALSGTYKAGEKSALYSPSFDLSSLTRPMISFNSMVQTEISDGVVLEYSADDLNVADPNKKWIPLGTTSDGQAWYTAQGIAGRPGTQLQNDWGWSGFINDPNAADPTTAAPIWINPKHVLDAVYSTQPAPYNPPTFVPNPAKAVFRFALGSAAPVVNPGAYGKGFALDNVRIGDRTRTILLESFANTSNPDPEEPKQNTFISNFISGTIGTEVVKVNYHVDFPGKDPFNLDDPADPSARALFYHIEKTPTSVLDGRETGPAATPLAADWVDATYKLRTLQLAQADIQINAATKPDGKLHITVDVTSAVLTGIPPETVLHVAVLEQGVPKSGLPQAKQSLITTGETDFSFVLKKLLPSAGGTKFGTLLPYGAPARQFGTNGELDWIPDPTRLYPAPNDLAVAVWLQQDIPPYEVYQVEYVKTGINDPPVVTGLEPLFAEDVKVYPVPANNEMHVVMPGLLADKAPLELIDQTGRTALQSEIAAGESRKTLNVSELASGVYILQINVGNGNFTRKKVVVVHGGN